MFFSSLTFYSVLKILLLNHVSYILMFYEDSSQEMIEKGKDQYNVRINSNFYLISMTVTI